MRFMAIWEVDGRSVIVMPRSKKSATFPTPEKALEALERQGKKVNMDTRGLVKDTSTGAVVATIAL